jgi:hypothetical protein
MDSEHGSWASRARQGVVLPGTYWSDRAAHGTEEKRQEEKAVLHQRAREREAGSGARFQGKARSVVSGRTCRLGARQVFDELLSTRARTREADRKNTKGMAC